ncbi:hypothetical protein HNQ07_002155 [Deinococcus metalli]|uniref:Peptidase C1A papain C-terminal domain-containing protein n=1 Tax=Deinococcus metalli TaxID=1141878 RepID=A0A7W8KEJ9_9DEIO|nr:C1 family peptidase [Deinococcus metalli]MBB5376691.1 hypothetical protein [Deinococcus metalli]
MRALQRLALASLTLGVLAACGGGGSPKPGPDTVFTDANAWSGAAPSDAEVVSADEFRQRVGSGELAVISSATLEAQRAAREQQFQTDRSFLQGVTDPSPTLKSLLQEAAGASAFEGDRPVKRPDGQTVVLFGLGSQLREVAETERRAQSVANALDDYRLSYSLLAPDLAAQLPAPDTLQGAPLAEVQAALESLEALLGAHPTALKAARLEPGGGLGPQAIAPGNGTDNNGPCTPTNYVKRYWFPLKNFVSPVKNQASRGTCWAFTAIGALESRERVQNDNPADLSEQFLVNKVKQDWDANDYSDGYWSERALDTAADKGQAMPPEGSWTYNGATSRPSVKDGDSGSYANTCSGYTGTCSDTAHESRRVCSTFIFTVCSYVRVTFGGPGVASSKTVQVWKSGNAFDLARLRQYLSSGHVLMASFPVYKGFMDDVTNNGVVSNYKTTKLDDKGKEVDGSYGGHAVQIVGFLSNADLTSFGTTPNIGGGGYFIIKNSWGCNAGDAGYYYVPADYVSQRFTSLSVLNFDTRRSDAWTREQATPGGSEAPSIEIRSPSVLADLRVEKDLTSAFKITHAVAKSVTLTVTSDRDGTVYTGPWSTDSSALFGSTLKYSFGSVGTRTLTLVARYGTRQASATMTVTVVNTAPTISLAFSGDPHQSEDYPIVAQIVDPNEADVTRLCTNTTWSVDAPDTLSATSGCAVKVKFGATGSRQVRVSTRDSEGQTASRTLTLNVLPPSVNPYPRVVSSGVYARDFNANLRLCYDRTVGSGATIDLREKGCRQTVVLPEPQRYSAQVQVENPSGEALKYDWTLYVTDNAGERPLYVTRGSASAEFPLYPYKNAVEVTNNCRITVTVNAPDPTRSKTLTVWTGRCTYYSTYIG